MIPLPKPAEERRVRIRADDLGAAKVRALVDWLHHRGDVVHVDHDARLSVIEVRFREDARGAGAFLRSLRDRIFLLGSAPRRRDFRVEIAHALAGRARLRVHGGDDDEVIRLAAWLGEREGVHRAAASAPSRSILIHFDPDRTSATALLAAIAASDPREWPEVPAIPSRGAWAKAIGATAALAAATAAALPPPITGGIVAMTAIPSARRALAALEDRRLSVDLLDLAAVGISIGTGQPATGALITWLLAIGDLVLERTQDRARAAISKLSTLDVPDAWRIKGDGRTERVPAKKLRPGDRIAVYAGDRIAADGVVVDGAISVDEKALTGESMPRARRPGDRVMAATALVEGQGVIAVDRVGSDTAAAKIVQILHGAGAKPMTLQRETERIADRLVLPTFGVAAGAGFLAAEIDRATSVLITDFGSGLRISAPTSALAAMIAAAREGILVKGGQFLERLSRTDTVVFDKTGTLTRGEPEIVIFEAVARRSPVECAALAAAVEARQKHPLAQAIRRHAERMGIRVDPADLGSEVSEIGLGVSARARGHEVMIGGERMMGAHAISAGAAAPVIARLHATGTSCLFVAVDGRVEAVIGVADVPRDESVAVVRAIREGGRREVLLMSGDARRTAESIGARLGVDGVMAELLPEDKAKQVRALQRAGRTVAMVGDGVNDAPALAAADVGVSLTGGTDVALETADVVLLHGGLLELPRAFAVADAAMASVRRGLGLVVIPNAVAIVLGALGLIPPGVAAAINNGSTVAAALSGLSPLCRR